jgi:hypothetical protein
VQSPSLEINANDAGKINGSRKDHWHPSNTLQLKKSLSIAFWRTQGTDFPDWYISEISFVFMNRLIPNSTYSSVGERKKISPLPDFCPYQL